MPDGRGDCSVSKLLLTVSYYLLIVSKLLLTDGVKASMSVEDSIEFSLPFWSNNFEMEYGLEQQV